MPGPRRHELAEDAPASLDRGHLELDRQLGRLEGQQADGVRAANRGQPLRVERRVVGELRELGVDRPPREASTRRGENALRARDRPRPRAREAPSRKASSSGWTRGCGGCRSSALFFHRVARRASLIPPRAASRRRRSRQRARVGPMLPIGMSSASLTSSYARRRVGHQHAEQRLAAVGELCERLPERGRTLAAQQPRGRATAPAARSARAGRRRAAARAASAAAAAGTRAVRSRRASPDALGLADAVEVLGEAEPGRLAHVGGVGRAQPVGPRDRPDEARRTRRRARSTPPRRPRARRARARRPRRRRGG